MSSTTSSGQSWDEFYSELGFAFGTEPNDFLSEVAGDIAMGDSLVLGDGEGRNGVYLASLGHQVVTVDMSSVGVEKSIKLARENRVNIDAQVGDLSIFDLGVARWSSIISIFCHLPKSLRVDVQARIKTALRPGGTFVLEAYTKANIGRGVGGPQNDDMTVELSELEDQFAGYKFLVNQTVERQIVEGKYHNGMSATTQFVAVKPA